jgi:phospholipid/cholesterol/gamma-HCH transport system permease protein
MEPSGIDPAVTIEKGSDTTTLHFSGALTALRLEHIETYLFESFLYDEYDGIVCNFERLIDFDTSAAIMLLAFRKKCQTLGHSCDFYGLSAPYEKLLGLSETHTSKSKTEAPEPPAALETLGMRTIERLATLITLSAFIGKVAMIALSYFHRFRNIRYKEIVFEIYESAIRALGVIGLITFLIGVVIAYQSSIQLKLYGANIFIVDMLGIGIFRELSPLLVAVVVAGRSGSAYAAQIGVMKITEELDAMRTMGFDPYAFLVLPRIIALTIMMPVLIFFADIMGVLGGMLVSKIELGISPEFFLERFANVIDIRHFWVGIVKGPFFALLIASIGIYRGLQVQNDTQSIGFNTTKSVVESIFAVIICDAIFSIIFTNLDI